jgi:exodeoxyribonuclease V beta subunit
LVVRHAQAWHAVFRHADGYPAARALADAAAMQESLRLCYVALTRAESRVYVAIGCGGKQTRRGALGWLLRPDGALPDAKATDEWPETRAAVDALVAASHGTMDALTMDGTIGHAPVPPAHDRQSLTARVDPARPITTWRVTSYTQLTAAREADADVADPGAPVDRTPRTDLDLLPPGATSGVALHRLFELLDFDADDATIATATAETLEHFGLLGTLAPEAQARVVDATAAMTAATLRTTVPSWGFALRDVPRARTLREWNFNLTLEQADLRRVAEALRTTGGASAECTGRIARLAQGTTDGFLTGVVDLVFEHQGKWYLVDWKSNHLGHDPAAYGTAGLATEMEANHYVLQYQLYLVALDRYLRSRVADWDPATMLGGVGYVFLRGGAWFLDAPRAEVIAAVGAAL